ncbi:PIR Superfamily Protein [Plasmodium ovale curtisi]|uniref:PIR Superfamily Protein n=1 Tax=Plasmodium ovale curtisi TaxID=864141 RepID=A0A1A8X8V1_PLAOA|nr:PIR Superfamily Protein [Plasmodium ovale curtisi]
MVEGEEDENVINVPEDNYYPYLSSFPKYLQNFKEVIGESISDSSYHVRCSSIESIRFKGNSNFRDLCYNVAKYLNRLHNTKSNTDTHERCAHLNYILNSDESYYNITNYSKSDLINAYSELITNFNDVCYSTIELIDELTLKKLKDIYDMHESFGKVKSKEISCIDDCCTNAKKCASIYDNYIKNCYEDSIDYICDDLGKFKYEYETHMKSVKTVCTDTLKILTPPKKNNSSVTILIPCIVILIIPCFLFIFYKFTPFGLLLRTGILQMKKMLYNSDEESQDMSVNNPEYIPTSTKMKAYHIAYNSA